MDVISFISESPPFSQTLKAYFPLDSESLFSAAPAWPHFKEEFRNCPLPGQPVLCLIPHDQ